MLTADSRQPARRKPGGRRPLLHGGPGASPGRAGGPRRPRRLVPAGRLPGPRRGGRHPSTALEAPLRRRGGRPCGSPPDGAGARRRDRPGRGGALLDARSVRQPDRGGSTPMKVTVQLFGPLAEQAGVPRLEVTVSGATVQDVLAAVAIAAPALKLDPSVRFAVNTDYAEPSAAIR